MLLSDHGCVTATLHKYIHSDNCITIFEQYNVREDNSSINEFLSEEKIKLFLDKTKLQNGFNNPNLCDNTITVQVFLDESEL